ncbi:MAG: CoA-binding protein [Comamonadaceae bacterium]|nr:MAG: CoA-binding protein [Comamonadaceae bacterium]
MVTAFTPSGASSAAAPEPSRTGAAVARLLNPRSVTIIGASAKPGASSHAIVKNLVANGYQGEIHLVGRTAATVEGREIRTSIADLPEGIDLAILAVPADAVLDTLIQLADRGVGAAVSFASGFAEYGPEGRRLQEQIGETARNLGVRLIGPNCIGYFNYADSFHVAMVDMGPLPPMPRHRGPALALVTQSGGIGAHLAGSLEQRGVPVSYSVTTGNEADLDLADFVEFFAHDPATGGVLVYAEQIRDSRRFLAAARTARARGKHVVVMHPGRSEASREATQSHTGALTQDYHLMRTVLEHAGVAVVDSLEELVDVGQLLLRFPEPPVAGLGFVTSSGAICAIAQDYCDELGVDVPELSPNTANTLRAVLPDYLQARNPLDLGTLLQTKPDSMSTSLDALVTDSAVGSILVSLPVIHQSLSLALLEAFIASTAGTGTPAIYVVQTEDKPFWPDFDELAHDKGAIVMRSPERAMRALATLTRIGRLQARQRRSGEACRTADPLRLSSGPQPEWRSKEILGEISLAVPPGGLATTAYDAVRIASRVGYPVVAKIQSAALPHKTDVGGVVVGLADEAALRAAFSDVIATVRDAHSDVTIDGILVEAMAEPGLELVIGARRDLNWGAVVLVGLGGVWIEVLGDVRLLPTDLAPSAIKAELLSLRAAGLLRGARGAEAVDLNAVADLVSRVGVFVEAHPEITELDLNPVVARPDGVVALDALLVARTTTEPT